jgi:hypothetical protein
MWIVVVAGIGFFTDAYGVRDGTHRTGFIN